MSETRRFIAHYNHQLHLISGYIDMDQKRDTDPVTPIEKHEGSKYLRWITAANQGCGANRNFDPPRFKIEVDVYCVIEAFGVTCPAIAHAIKKLLCAGTRGKGDTEADLIGVLAAVNRAIELGRGRKQETA
jgi:hypothetical protein